MRFLVVFCLAIMLMFAEHHFNQMKKIRLQLSVIVYPLQKIVDFPWSLYHLSYNYFLTKKTLIEENNSLKTEQFILQSKLQKFDALALENSRLKALLNSAINAEDELLVATILSVDPDPFMHQIILDKGTNYGVYLGQPVVDANGVMGSIVEVNPFTSRVMLLTDASHAVPVENTRNSIRAIAIGCGVTDYLELKHVTNTTDIVVGDKLVTSGLDGKYPAGYPVGIVNSVEHDVNKPFAAIYVEPSAELSKGRQVLLIKARDQDAPAKL